MQFTPAVGQGFCSRYEVHSTRLDTELEDHKSQPPVTDISTGQKLKADGATFGPGYWEGEDAVFPVFCIS